MNFLSLIPSAIKSCLLSLVNLMLIGLPSPGPPCCSLDSTLIPLMLFVASKISARITFDFLLLSQSVYSKLIDPIKSSDASDCSLTFPLKE